MNGRAPNSPATGSHVSVSQKLKPNSRIDSCDSRNRPTPMATTMRDQQQTANTPVPARKTSSSTVDGWPADAAIYCTLICSSAFSSMSATFRGSGA